jgi:hypothetical protein
MINSNSYIGIGTSNADHRITIRAEDSTVLGPSHMGFYRYWIHLIHYYKLEIGNMMILQ